MYNLVTTIIASLKEPTVAVMIISVIALVVAGMSVYGMTQAIKRKGR